MNDGRSKSGERREDRVRSGEKNSCRATHCTHHRDGVRAYLRHGDAAPWPESIPIQREMGDGRREEGGGEIERA